MSQLYPKIYVVCLAAYNDGILHGEWIDANQDAEDLEMEIKKMLAESPIQSAKEWAIHDQDDFYFVKLSEYESLEDIAEVAAFIAEEGELGAALVYEYSDVDKARRVLEEDYYGAYDNEEDFAAQHLKELANLDETVSFYMDYKHFANDIFVNDFFALKVRDKTHIFINQ